jgi:hypothetical protein
VRFKPLVLVASLALLPGCKDSSGPSGLNGTLSFSYSGAMTGNFSASGEFNPLTMETAAWAAGERDDVDGILFVGAAVPRNSTSHDVLGIEIERLSPGTATISANCTTNCAFVALIFGSENTGSGFLLACDIEAGTVTITEITTTRARGTFSGNGTCFAPGTGNPQAFAVANGAFDVALISAVP